MAQKKQASGFLKAWVDGALSVPDEPIRPEAAKLIDEQLSIARAALDDIAKDIRASMDRDLAMQARRKRAGDKTAKQRKAEAQGRYDDWLREADHLIKSGERDPRSVAGILAKRHGVTTTTIRKGINRARNKTNAS